MSDKKVIVTLNSNIKGMEWYAKFNGKGYYGLTAEEAEANLRAKWECPAETEYRTPRLIPIKEHPWATGKPFETQILDKQISDNAEAFTE